MICTITTQPVDDLPDVSRKKRWMRINGFRAYLKQERANGMKRTDDIRDLKAEVD